MDTVQVIPPNDDPRGLGTSECPSMDHVTDAFFGCTYIQHPLVIGTRGRNAINQQPKMAGANIRVPEISQVSVTRFPASFRLLTIRSRLSSRHSTKHTSPSPRQTSSIPTSYDPAMTEPRETRTTTYYKQNTLMKRTMALATTRTGRNAPSQTSKSPCSDTLNSKPSDVLRTAQPLVTQQYTLYRG